VLVAGSGEASDDRSSILYDPVTNLWSPTGEMAAYHPLHTATLLMNGRVLVVSGSAEVYDPATGTWSATSGMVVARRWHTATLLLNGKVLVAGGFDSGGLLATTAELYDPVTNSWSATGGMTNARGQHAAARLPDGQVLVVGGNVHGVSFSPTAEVYDPATGTWSSTGDPPTDCSAVQQTVLLADGKVLVVGGSGSGFCDDTLLYPATLPHVWYFAEGYTGPGFDEYLTIQNPNNTSGSVRLSYFVEGQASPETRDISVEARSRTTIAVHLPSTAGPEGPGTNPGGLGRLGSGHAARITSSLPVVVERPMYFVYGNSIDGGHDVVGHAP
jgi:hypothetical protein